MFYLHPVLSDIPEQSYKMTVISVLLVSIINLFFSFIIFTTYWAYYTWIDLILFDFIFLYSRSTTITAKQTRQNKTTAKTPQTHTNTDQQKDKNKVCALLPMCLGDSVFSIYPTAPGLSSYPILWDGPALAQHSNLTFTGLWVKRKITRQMIFFLQKQLPVYHGKAFVHPA